MFCLFADRLVDYAFVDCLCVVGFYWCLDRLFALVLWFCLFCGFTW